MTNSTDPYQKTPYLDLHCLLRQSISCSAREGLMELSLMWLRNEPPNRKKSPGRPEGKDRLKADRWMDGWIDRSMEGSTVR